MMWFRKIRTIRAINKLLKYYKKGVPAKVPVSYGNIPYKKCPLCVLFGRAGDGCEQCPWIAIDHIHCMNAKYAQQPAWHRIARLERWKTKLQTGKEN